MTSARLRALGFVHGFTTRHGGVSAAPFQSLNLGASVGDDPEDVRENHRRVASDLGYDPARLHTVFQAHGATVRVVDGTSDVTEGRAVEADALVAVSGGEAVGVRVADCVPVLVADPETGRVAAIHAGWKGVVAEVVRAAVTLLQPEPSARGRLVAAIGPHIGPCCFEVGPEVAEAIVKASATEVRDDARGAKPFVNLGRAVALQLAGLGLTEVESVGGCTVCEKARWFSYRAEGPKSGRMMGLIVSR